MDKHKYRFIEYSQYYIWWLKNCSQCISIEQIKIEVDGIIDKIELLKIPLELIYDELDFLTDLTMLFNYDVERLKKFYKDMDEYFICPYQYEYKYEYQYEYKY